MFGVDKYVEQKRAETIAEISKEMRLLYGNEYEKQIRAEAIEEVSRAMYHQCFECDNDENMQKWDSGNWFRYKLFENVIEQLKEQNKIEF